MNNYEQATQEVRDTFNALCQGRVEAAVKAEREACAVIAETAADCLQNSTFEGVAAAIRERSASAGARGEASIRGNT